VAEAELQTVPFGRHAALGLVFFESIDAACAKVGELVAAGATATEFDGGRDPDRRRLQLPPARLSAGRSFRRAPRLCWLSFGRKIRWPWPDRSGGR